MGDPVTMAAVGMGSAGVGSVLRAFGAAQSGRAQAQQLQYQAGIADFNRKVALQNEDYASAQGEEEAVNTGLAGRFKSGKERVGFGASGIDVNSGSAKQVLASQDELNARDLATVRNKAARVALGYATEAEQNQMQSTLYSMGAQNAREAVPLNVASSLISGASSVSSMYFQGRQAGAFS